jgi:outer membrane lipase/esterase
MKLSRRTWAALGVAFLLAACGGGDELAPKAKISKVYVMGDSLADVGTFGFKFTVQNSADPKGFPIWPQLVANSVGLDGSAQCNFFRFTGTTFAPNTTAGCTNYAIGGGRIVTPAASGGAASPATVATQLAAKAAAGNYVEGELVLIDGGGNDAADLVSAYLGAASGAAGVAAYQAFLAQQLDAATIGAALTQPNGAAIAAGAYMQKLADTFYGQIKANPRQGRQPRSRAQRARHHAHTSLPASAGRRGGRIGRRCHRGSCGSSTARRHPAMGQRFQWQAQGQYWR